MKNLTSYTCPLFRTIMRGRGMTTIVNYLLKPPQLTTIKPVIKNIRQISTINPQDQDSNANTTFSTTPPYTTKIEQETTSIKDSKEEASITGSSNTQQSLSTPPKELNKPKAFTKRLKIIPSEISTDWSKPLEKLEIPITTRKSIITLIYIYNILNSNMFINDVLIIYSL